jgi:hypothetical protein
MNKIKVTIKGCEVELVGALNVGLVRISPESIYKLQSKMNAFEIQDEELETFLTENGLRTMHLKNNELVSAVGKINIDKVEE